MLKRTMIRCLSMILVLCSVVAVMPVFSVETEAAYLPYKVNTVTTNAIKALCDAYGFKSGTYWTYDYSKVTKTASALDSAAKSGYKSSNVPYGATTYTSPAYGNGKVHYGEYIFNGGRQCYGFAQFLGYQLTGEYPSSTWKKYTTVSQVKSAGGLKVGDIICAGSSKSRNHSAMVLTINGSTFTTVECWGGSNSKNKIWYNGKFNSKYNTLDSLANNHSYFYVLRYNGQANASYTVTYDPNGGKISSGNKPVTVTKGGTYGTQPTATRTGLVFDGWYTAKTGGSRITSTSSVNITANQTLYAHWSSIKTYKVTFNANGGKVTNYNGNSGSTVSKTVTKGSTYGALPVPTRNKYIFDGWYTAKSGGTKITASSKVNLSGNQTLYAHWTASTLKMTSFDGPSGVKKNMKNYGLRGVATSNCNITSVYACVKYQSSGQVVKINGKDVAYSNRSWNKKTYNIQTNGVNSAISFGKLKTGKYIYFVEIKDASGNSITKQTYFEKK